MIINGLRLSLRRNSERYFPWDGFMSRGLPTRTLWLAHSLTVLHRFQVRFYKLGVKSLIVAFSPPYDVHVPSNGLWVDYAFFSPGVRKGFTASEPILRDRLRMRNMMMRRQRRSIVILIRQTLA
jgi:hypothetical protein